MNDWRPLLNNRLTRVRTYARFDADGQMIFREEMSADDANALADQVAEHRALEEHGNEWRHRLRRSTQANRTHIATIPAIVVNQLMRDGVWGDPAAMTKWLNSSENQCWRTGGGVVKVRATGS